MRIARTQYPGGRNQPGAPFVETSQERPSSRSGGLVFNQFFLADGICQFIDKADHIDAFFER